MIKVVGVEFGNNILYCQEDQCGPINFLDTNWDYMCRIHKIVVYPVVSTFENNNVSDCSLYITVSHHTINGTV